MGDAQTLIIEFQVNARAVPAMQRPLLCSTRSSVITQGKANQPISLSHFTGDFLPIAQLSRGGQQRRGVCVSHCQQTICNPICSPYQVLYLDTVDRIWGQCLRRVEFGDGAQQRCVTICDLTSRSKVNSSRSARPTSPLSVRKLPPKFSF